MSFHIEVFVTDKASAIAYVKKTASLNPHFPAYVADAAVAFIEKMQDLEDFGVKLTLSGHIPAEQCDYPNPAAFKMEVQNIWLVGKNPELLKPVEEGGSGLSAEAQEALSAQDNDNG